RVLLVQELFNAPDWARRDTKLALVTSYHEAGELALAIQTAQSLLREPLPAYFRNQVLWHHVWLLLRTGDVRGARAAVDRWLVPGGPEGEDFLPLLLHRALVRAAEKDWAGSEKDVEQYLARVELGPHDLEGHLLLGFLRQRRGDELGAVAAWSAGYRAGRRG